MTTDSNHFDVAIVGGGMVGMTLAIALGREGLRVAMIERSALPSQLEEHFDGRVSAIALGSKRLLDNIGVWEEMAGQAQPINDIRVSDGATPVFLHYDHQEVRDATGGEPFGHIVENRYIRHALHRAAGALSSISIFDNTVVESFESDDMGVALRLKDRDALRCRLLVGADGKQSFIRRLSGIRTTEWNYKQTAIVCTIEHEKPHGGLAQERFLSAGPFAVLPMTGNRSSLVWVEPQERVSIYMQLPHEEFEQEITERVGGYLGAITARGQRFSYPLSLMHAHRYTGRRLALIGDAAHAIHPIAGQGVNLGFRDVAALTEVIAEKFRLGLDIGSEEVLNHYQRWRRFDNVTMLAVTDGLNRLFTNNILPIRAARDVGMWAVGMMPPLKRFFMKHAMGLSGDLPDLIRKQKNG
jgi:2-octaprenyl-6-methoxyphenol hydroxylase